MKKRFRLYCNKTFVAILSLLLILSLFPFTATALNGSQNDKTVSQTEDVVDLGNMTSNPDYVERETTNEISLRREENVKHFRMEDGSVQAIVYGYAVHRKDESGVWQDIDNRIEAKNEKGLTVCSTADNRVAFSESDGHVRFTLQENGYRVSMTLISEQTENALSKASISNHEPATSQLIAAASKISVNEREDAYREIDNTSRILYPIKNGVEIEYILEANDVKENIIVTEAQEKYVYAFQLETEGLSPKMQDDGSIILFDKKTGDPSYVIPAPFMYDAKGTRCDDVFYTLENDDAGNTLLIIVADSAWVNDSATVFPVTVDPTLRQTILYDTYINAGAASTNYGSSSQLWVGTLYTSYIKANLTSIPQGSDIDFATFSAAYYYYDGVTSGTLNVGVYQVLQSWSEYSWTWNTANQYSNLGLSTTRISYRTARGDSGAYASSPKWINFLVTDAVKSWFNGSSNYGLGLKYEGGTNTSVIFYSYEAGTTYRPYFIIFYTEPVIEEGVYYLRTQYGNLYLESRNGGFSSGTVMQLSSKSEGSRSQLFKITYIQDYGYDRYYDIRPMTNSALGLYAPISGDNRTVTANDMSLSDEWWDIPQTQRWTIQRYGTSYATLQNAFTDNGGYLCASNKTAGAAVTAPSDYNTNCNWVLEKYTGDSINGISLTAWQSTLMIGDSFDFDTIMYSSIVGANGPVTYSVANTDGATVSRASIDASTGVLTAQEAGKVTVNMTFAGAPYQWSYYVTILIPDGELFLQNRHYKKYAQVDNDDAPSYVNDGGLIEQWSLNGGKHQRWMITHVGDGYYKITSAVSGYAITVPTGSETNSNVSLILTPYSDSNDNQKWTITKTSYGSYKIKAKSSESYTTKDLAMAVISNLFYSDGLDVRQCEYLDNTSYKDEWMLEYIDYDYILLDFHVPTSAFTVQCVGTLANGGTWNPLILASISAWNITVGTNISVSASSSYTCEVDNYFEYWYGLMTPVSVFENSLSSATLQINSYTLPDDVNVRKSTITHEMGHLLGLKDNPPIDEDLSLMCHGRDRTLIYAPQPYDVANVKYVYNLY